MKQIALSILVFCMLTSAFSQTQKKGLLIKVTGMRNENGNLLVALYNNKSDFLNANKAVYQRIVSATTDNHIIFFENIPMASYAVAVIHDENANGKMDTNFLGIPTEYIGTSNNIRSRFGAPSYESSVFFYNGVFLLINIELY
ncbi:MAG: DUF2141 domain-containing protein [Bacteroidales bacterium]|nr:DUF2141 domain-containing protein [Bacteroidales bacterium]